MRKLAQVTLTFVFADVTEDNEIGELAQPVQIQVSGSDWKKKWSTKHNEFVMSNILKQLNTSLNGSIPETPSVPIVGK